MSTHDAETRAIHLRVGRLAGEAATNGAEAFLRRYRDPFVLVFSAEPSEAETPHRAFQTMAGSVTRGGSASDLVSADTPVWRVRKATQHFPDKITIGRAPNNDIIVISPGVSKLHAWFTRTGDEVALTDAGSRNGTVAGDDRLEAMQSVPVTDGTAIRLGPGVELVFFEPETFLSMCARMQA